ncbi:MAG: family 16 glycoside hydrolase [Porticoccaceae bacterium]
MLHNGVLVQNHVAVQGPTAWIGHLPYETHGCAPLRLQDHGNPTRFRNIWIREL